jgi:hypothetical protein
MCVNIVIHPLVCCLTESFVIHYMHLYRINHCLNAWVSIVCTSMCGLTKCVRVRILFSMSYTTKSVNTRYGLATAPHPPGVIDMIVFGIIHDTCSISSLYDNFVWVAICHSTALHHLSGASICVKTTPGVGGDNEPRGSITITDIIQWHEHTCRWLYLHRHSEIYVVIAMK